MAHESTGGVSTHNAFQRKIEMLTSEKKKLIEELSSIRKQYNTACYDQHKKAKELSAIRYEKQAVEMKIKNLYSANERKVQNLNEKLARKEKLIEKLSEEKENFIAALSRTQSELLQCQKKLNGEKGDNTQKAKTITLISGENRRLIARLGQYQTNILQRGSCANKNDISSGQNATAHVTSSKEYEVERFVAHKVKNRKRHFLVRWKGYSSKHDSWESEKNIMNCPKILSEYLKMNNLRS